MTGSFTEYIPREVEPYIYSSHYTDRMHDDQRPVDIGLTEATIKNGQPMENKESTGWKIVHTIDGVEITLVCDITSKLDLIVVTGWGRVVEDHAAEQSGRWSHRVLENTRMLQVLSSQGGDIIETLEGIHVPDPVDICDHRVRSSFSWNYVRCVDCEMEASTRSTLARLPCDD